MTNKNTKILSSKRRSTHLKFILKQIYMNALCFVIFVCVWSARVQHKVAEIILCRARTNTLAALRCSVRVASQPTQRLVQRKLTVRLTIFLCFTGGRGWVGGATTQMRWWLTFLMVTHAYADHDFPFRRRAAALLLRTLAFVF